ncbi:hypothetical protein C0992_004044, partial [Termitomyces sp. T32_za158]
MGGPIPTRVADPTLAEQEPAANTQTHVRAQIVPSNTGNPATVPEPVLTPVPMPVRPVVPIPIRPFVPQPFQEPAIPAELPAPTHRMAAPLPIIEPVRLPMLQPDQIARPGLFLGEDAGTRREPSPIRRVRHGRPPAIGRLLSAADKVFPRKVVVALEQRMLDYIPLDYLTDEACRRAARDTSALDSSLIVTNGRLRPTSTFDASKEEKLSFDDWSAAADNFVEALRIHLRTEGYDRSGGPVANEIADSFAKHFRHLKHMPNARLRFSVVLDYDRRLRSLFVRQSHEFRMDTFQADIWQECLTFEHDARLAEMASFLSRSQTSSTQ